LAARFLWAEVTHNEKEADRIADELKKSQCDLPGWSECLTEYWKYKSGRDANPYREGRDVANGLKSVLLSHHQLFSPFTSVGDFDYHKRCAYNPNLYSVFKGELSKVEWWFWGHEHTLAIYDGYMGLNRGRCVGCSAIPVFKNQQSYSTDTSLETFTPGQYSAWNHHAQLGNNGTDYNHAFAILELSGSNATATYYEIALGGTAPRLLFVE
jgi:hypothetical protein